MRAPHAVRPPDLYAAPGVIVPASRTSFSLATEWGSSVQCDICGRRGYCGEVGTYAEIIKRHPSERDWLRRRSWQASCLRGHGACEVCGRLIALNKSGSIRNGHKACGKPLAPAAEDPLPSEA